MYKTDDFIKERLLWKARQYELPTEFSFFYKDLPKSIQQNLRISLEETSGEPVLFFTKPTNEWTLVCTRQVICNDNTAIFTINFADIRRFKPTAFANIPDGLPIDVNEHKKSEWDKVTVIDQQNNIYVLHAAKGELFALWNILLMAARLH